MDKPVEKPRGLSRKAVVLLALGAALLVLATLAVPTVRRWSRAEAVVERARLRFATVVRGDLVRDASAQGKIVASLHPTLFSPSAGIVSLRVKAGAAVKKGERLAVVESPELKSRLAQERATLQSLRSALERQRIAARQSGLRNAQNVDLLSVRREAAERLLVRAQRTFEEGLLNKTDYEKAKDDLKIAELELRNAAETARLEKETADFDVRDRALGVERQESIVAELSRQVDELSIAAPFDGMVASLAVQDRDAVPANAPLLTVVNLSQYEVEISLPENYGTDAVAGTKARIAYEGTEYPGAVTAISPEIKDGQVKGTVVFEGAAPEGLKQSQRVNVRLVFETRSGVLKTPRGPFLEGGGGRSVYVVANGVATRRPIQIGAISVSEVEVVSGLSEGEEIILSDTSELGNAATVLLR